MLCDVFVKLTAIIVFSETYFRYCIDEYNPNFITR